MAGVPRRLAAVGEGARLANGPGSGGFRKRAASSGRGHLPGRSCRSPDDRALSESNEADSPSGRPAPRFRRSGCDAALVKLLDMAQSVICPRNVNR
jgi:hypothetical protein